MSTDLQQTLLQLFQQLNDNPDSIPVVPVEAWQEGSVEHQLLSSFRSVLERLQQSREQTREKEEQYRSIFEASTDGLVINDMEDGSIVEFNPAMHRMHGYAYEEFTALHPMAFIHPDSLSLFADYLNTVKAGHLFQARAVDMRKDGTLFPVDVHGTSFTYKGRPHVLGVVRDITEQVKAEEELREKEAEYRSIFEAVSDALFIVDLEDGHVIEANPAACKIYGYSYEEFIGLPPTAIIHPDVLPNFLQKALPAIKAGSDYHARGWNLRKDGTAFPIDVLETSFMYQGKQQMLAVVRDITEQVRAEQELEQRVEERTRELSTLLEVSHNVASTIELFPLLELILNQLQTLVRYNGAAILLVDGEDLVIAHYRGIWKYPDERLLHRRYRMEDAIKAGLPLSAYVLDDALDDSPASRKFRSANADLPEINSGAIRSWMNIPLLLKDKLIGLFQISSSEPHYYTAEHVKITQAIANQAAVAIENARLYEQAQELASLEERQRLARELHDSVSQALYGITLGTHTARALLERDPSRVVEPLNYVLSLADAALAEMRALIFELRPESLEKEGLVASLSKQTAALQSRHGIAISLSVCDEPDVPLKVKQELHRVTQEALHNVVKHAGADKVDVRLANDTEGITLEIHDDGRGFDTAASFPGHLGLRSMRERIERLGGVLQIESQPGVGTTIRAWIPV